MAKPNKDELAAVQSAASPHENGKLTTKVFGPSFKVMLDQRVLSRSLISNYVGQFDPYRITFRQMNLMRKDPHIRLGLAALTMPLMNAPYHFQCDDPLIAEFARRAYDRIHARLITQASTRYAYGFAGMAKQFKLAPEARDWTYEDDAGREKKVWTPTDVDPVVWAAPRSLRAEAIKPSFAADGVTFNGIEYRGGFAEYEKTAGDGPDIPVTHALWFAHERDEEWGDWFGYPRTGYAFRYWWSYWFQFLLKDRHFEADADPPLVIGVPDELVIDPDDPTKTIPAQELGKRIGMALREGATVVLPTSVYENEESGRISPHARKWSADFLRGGENLKPMQDSLDDLTKQKLRAVLLGPEDAILATQGGKQTAEQLNDLITAGREMDMAEIDQVVNDHLLPDLLRQNFVDPPECRKITTGFRPEDMTLVNQIITILTQQDPASLDLDVRKLVKSAGLPQTPPGASRAQAAGAGGGPPNTQGDQGEQGGAPPTGAPPAAPDQPAGAATGTAATGNGITVSGFDLDLDLGELPPLKAYDDPNMHLLMSDVYGILEGLVEEVYSAPLKVLNDA